jgi:hypothetical protein
MPHRKTSKVYRREGSYKEKATELQPIWFVRQQEGNYKAKRNPAKARKQDRLVVVIEVESKEETQIKNAQKARTMKTSKEIIITSCSCDVCGGSCMWAAKYSQKGLTYPLSENSYAPEKKTLLVNAILHNHSCQKCQQIIVSIHVP